MSNERTAFHQDVIKTLIETQSIDFDKLGSTMSRFGAKAALEGHDLVSIINKHFIINCGWPGPVLDSVIDQARRAGLKANG